MTPLENARSALLDAARAVYALEYSLLPLPGTSEHGDHWKWLMAAATILKLGKEQSEYPDSQQ